MWTFQIWILFKYLIISINSLFTNRTNTKLLDNLGLEQGEEPQNNNNNNNNDNNNNNNNNNNINNNNDIVNPPDVTPEPDQPAEVNTAISASYIKFSAMALVSAVLLTLQ